MNSAKTTDFVSSLQNAARENPVSALMIGTGLAWMVFGNSRLTAAVSMLEPATHTVAYNAGKAMNAASDVAVSAREGVISTTSAVVDKAKDAVEGMTIQTSSAYDSLKDKTSTAGDFAAESIISPLVENLKQAFKQQPLLIGGVGLAIGSVIAATLPRTKIEIDSLANTALYVSSEAASIAEAAIRDVSDRAERAAKAMSDEASAQGLTLEAAKSGATDIGRKVKDVAALVMQKSPDLS